jgi:hypothetical protein
MNVHRFTVDAYAAQHPGKSERRSTQSIWVHLAGLYLLLEKGLADRHVRRVMSSMTRNGGSLHWLEPPARYSFTVSDVVLARDAAEHAALVQQWARDVWQAWRAHHPEVRSMAEKHLAGLG